MDFSHAVPCMGSTVLVWDGPDAHLRWGFLVQIDDLDDDPVKYW